MNLAAATRSETTKQFTTSMWWILAIILFVYVAFAAGSLALAFGASASGSLPGTEVPPIPADGLASTLYSAATSFGYVFPLLIGTLIVTAEFRHKTLTPTFLATPGRGTVLSAKVAAGILMGVIYGVIGILASVAPSAILLVAFDLNTELDDAATWAMLGRMLLATVLWVIIGLGVGALVRNQVGAIVGVLVFTQFLEPIARLAASVVEGAGDITQVLPGAASDTLVGASIYTAVMPAGGSTLEWWGGGLVLLGYAVVLLVLGHVTSWRRDVS